MTWDETGVNDSRSVVTRIGSRARRIGDHRCAQQVVRIPVCAAHRFIHHLLDAEICFPSDIHPDGKKHDDDARVLANGTAPFGAQA